MISASESLQDYAKRLGVSIERAYREWHLLGNVLAQAWQRPAKVPNSTNDGDHVTIAGGRCLGLTALDIRNIGAAKRVS